MTRGTGFRNRKSQSSKVIETGATALERLLRLTSLVSAEAGSHYPPSLPCPDNQKWLSSAQREGRRVGDCGRAAIRYPDFLARGTGSGSSKCLLPPEKGLSCRRALGWGLLTSVGNWHVRVRSSQPGTPLPAQPSYNHPPLLVTEAATPHCTL